MYHCPGSPAALGWFRQRSKPNENGQSKDRALSVPKSLILMDTVGAMWLDQREGGSMDPYCVISVDGEEVHRTARSKIPTPDNPIWTASQKSLCLLEIPSRAQPEAPPFPIAGEVTLAVWDGSRCLGVVELSYEDVFQGNGERQEFPLLPPASTSNSTHEDDDRVGSSLDKEARQSLAIRFRTATENDVNFMKHKTPFSAQTEGLASDINFRAVKLNPLFQRNTKYMNGKEYFRVHPHPENPKDTEWMTKEQIEAESLKPSERWVSAGHGSTGTLRLEILSCDDLPNLDLQLNDFTDPFIGIVFEDNMVRTDVIFDNLNPRWMPWSNRAFAFNIRHPTSILMIGAFDYDEVPIDHHDPIGRVVINTSSFKPNTEYILHYKLHHDPREIDQNPRGSIRIRLRIDWEDESEAMKLSFTPAPRFMINVDNIKSHAVLRYLTRGAVDMEQSSIDTVKLYFSELISYWQNYCYALDVLADILLWRGRVRVGKRVSVWFPLHSMLLFGATVLSFECPKYIIPIFLYGIAWILLSMNYHASRHPYPWLRVKKSEEINMMAVFGISITRPESVDPFQGVHDKEVMERLDRYKAERMSALIKSILYFQLKVYRVYSTTSLASVKMATEIQESGFNFLSVPLYYLHMMLKYQVKYIRLFRSFVNCKSYSTDVFATNCIMGATLWLVFPCRAILVWVFRILIWTILGPWMKLADIVWVHSWFETREELLERAKEGSDQPPRLPNLDSFLENEMIRKMAKKGRIVAENSYKKKDMRDRLYGSYCEIVPKADTSRYPSVPLPPSSAKPIQQNAIQKQEPWYHIPGQLLDDSILPEPSRPEKAALEAASLIAKKTN